MPCMSRSLLIAALLATLIAASPAWGAVRLQSSVRHETRGRNGRQVHRIKFLTDTGRVKTVEVDASTGDLR